MRPSLTGAAALAGALGTALFSFLYISSMTSRPQGTLSPGQERAVLKAFRERGLPSPAPGSVTAADVLPLAELSNKILLHRMARERASADRPCQLSGCKLGSMVVV